MMMKKVKKLLQESRVWSAALATTMFPGRMNKTKLRMWRYFTHCNTRRYIDVMQKIAFAYNKHLHSSTRIKPAEVNLYNVAKARSNLQRRTHRLGKEGVPQNYLNTVSMIRSTLVGPREASRKDIKKFK